MEEVVAGVGAVVVHPVETDKILIVEEDKADPNIKKQAQSLSIPMGHLELGETPQEAITREVKEETGINNFIIEKVLGVYLIQGALGVVYIVTSDDHDVKGSLVNDDEISDVFWEETSRLLELRNLRPAVKQIINDYLDGIEYPLELLKDCR